MSTVDYIEINEQGVAGVTGTRSGMGYIKIVTDPNKFINTRQKTSKFEFPVTFSKSKRFYTPKYSSYKNLFFKKYGVIDWLPINQIDRNGVLNIKFRNKQTSDLVFFIEGVTEDGDFILEKKIIKEHLLKPSKTEVS